MPKIHSDLSPPVLLLAMPQVLDPFFHKSVVLLIHHEEEGSFGFILNRPTGIKVGEILKGMEVHWEGPDEAVAHFGGPVRPIPARCSSPHGRPTRCQRRSRPGGCRGRQRGGARLALTQHIGDLAQLAGNLPTLPPLPRLCRLGEGSWWRRSCGTTG